VPEEIIHSLGAVPVRLLGLSQTTEKARSKLPSWLCYYARRTLEDGLKGEFSQVDGIVGMTTDDTKIHLYSAYTFYVKHGFSYLIQTPYVRDELSLDFFAKELERFAIKLSQYLSVEFDEEKLRDSVKVYNRFRRLCEELCNLRSDDAPKLSGVDWMKVMLGSTCMLKDDFNRMLEEKLEHVKDSEGIKDYMLRVHVSGTDHYDLEILSLIESLGAVIVSDDLCTATGYFAGFVDESKSPLRGLAERYLSCSSCILSSNPDSLSIEDRIAFIKKRIKKSRAKAVIILRDRGCEICGHQYPLIIEALHSLPVLVLDVDIPVSVEQYATRIEAFIEAHAR
jgi:benzoyl-CoA reductase/2-hydroxyglutaryl-CoA dehydratase subunit BcrC/BadD/HgdB